MALDFRKRVEEARAQADAEDMDSGYAGPESPAPEEMGDDPIVCCPKCQHEFPESEGLYADEEMGESPPPPPLPEDDMGEDTPAGFTFGRQ